MINVAVTRQLWHELHTRAECWKFDLDQKTFVANWLSDVEDTLGCASCWSKVKLFCKLYPVDYGQELWLWSICLHDYVNKEMGHPLFYPDLTLAPLRLKGLIQ